MAWEVRINNQLRNDVEVVSFSHGYTSRANVARLVVGHVRHEAKLTPAGVPIPGLNQYVEISNDSFTTLRWAGYTWDMTPSGVSPGSREGIVYNCIGEGPYLNRHAVKINGSCVYTWNPATTPAVWDSPAKDKRRWRLWEIFIDILEHARGVKGNASGKTELGDHHAASKSVIDTYVPAHELWGWDVRQIKNVFGENYEVGEVRVSAGDRLWDKLMDLTELVPSAGLYVISTPGRKPVLNVIDMSKAPVVFVQFGKHGFHVDQPAVAGLAPNVIESDINFSLDGVINKVTVQGRDTAFYRTAPSDGTAPKKDDAVLPPALENDDDAILGTLIPAKNQEEADGTVRVWIPKVQELRKLFIHSRNSVNPDLIKKVLDQNPTLRQVDPDLPYGSRYKAKREVIVSMDGTVTFTDNIINGEAADAPPIPKKNAKLRLETYFLFPCGVTFGPEGDASSQFKYVADECIFDENIRCDIEKIAEKAEKGSFRFVNNAKAAMPKEMDFGIDLGMLFPLPGDAPKPHPNAAHEPVARERQEKIEAHEKVSEGSQGTSGRVNKFMTTHDEELALGYAKAMVNSNGDVRVTGGVTIDSQDLLTYNHFKRVSFLGLQNNRWSDLNAQIMEVTVMPMQHKMRLEFGNDVFRVGNYSEMRRRRKQKDAGVPGRKGIFGDVGLPNAALFATPGEHKQQQRDMRAKRHPEGAPSGIGGASPHTIERWPLQGLMKNMTQVRLGKTKPFTKYGVLDLDGIPEVDDDRPYPTKPYSAYNIRTLLVDESNPDLEPEENGPDFIAYDAMGQVIPVESTVFVVQILPGGLWLIVQTVGGPGGTLARAVGGPLDADGNPTAYPIAGFAKYSLEPLDPNDPRQALAGASLIEATVAHDIVVPKNEAVLVQNIGGNNIFLWQAHWLAFSENPIV